jgi:putative membrane protein
MLAAGLWLAVLAVPTPLARDMAGHIILMSIAAPAAAWLLAGRDEHRPSLAVAVAVQALLLFAWHLPLGSALAMHNAWGMTAMLATLFLAAVRFWQAVIAHLRRDWWRAVLALLVTGKLFCMLGVLLVFAPRSLGHDGVALADQQLAGLVMLAACPPTYVGAALIVCCRGIPGLLPERLTRIRRPS